MRVSIERLRWLLVAGALLLVVVLVGYIGYGRFRALQAYRQILKKNGISITHDTSGVTFSQSLQGKTVFTLKAAKATPLGDGKYTLHDFVLTLYGRMADRSDLVYGKEIAYDEKSGVARAEGEVQMDLAAPQVLTTGRGGPATAVPPGKAAVIHVRTSGLVYLRKLGVAATEQMVQFDYGGIRCTAKGAEFNASQSSLRLLADVLLDGEMRGQPVHLTAMSAYVDRSINVATMELPVVTSLDRGARARHAVVDLRPDGSVEHLLATGDVVLSSDTRTVRAAQLDARLSDQAKLQAARLSGGVTLLDSNPLRPAQGSAAEVQAAFTPEGTASSVTATGGAKIAVTPRGVGGARGLLREMQGAQMVASFVPGPKRSSSRLAEVQATGGAQARGESLVAKTTGVKTLLVAADDLRVRFKPGAAQRVEPESLTGAGHTLVQQDAPLGEQETSTGDALEGSFWSEGASVMLSSAVQTGHVVVHDRAAAKPVVAGAAAKEPSEVNATAAKASYDGETERLTLTGDAHLVGETEQVTAAQVVLDRRSGEADATGGVRGTLMNANAATDAPVTHVLSSSARFVQAGKLARFVGTDAAPARVWQGGSQVQAAVLVFDGERHTFSARPAAAGALVHAVFAAAPRAKASADSSVVRVASPRMDYNDVLREGVFAGGVRIESDGGETTSQEATVFLSAAAAGKTRNVGGPNPAGGAVNPVGGTLERVVLTGDVQLAQPGRHGSGEQLVYTAPKGTEAAGSYVLTGSAGHPPHVVDALQGSVTGPTLLFRDAGSTIVVAGEAAAGGRVHSEAPMRQK
jgi:lipopolysaccharide export system protein LptA